MKAKASDNIQDLTGHGLEFFTDKHGMVRLEFWNGTIVRTKANGNVDDTIASLDDTQGSGYVPLGLRIDDTEFSQDNVIYVDFVNKRRQHAS